VAANLKNLLYCWPELILQRFASWNAARE